MEYGFPRSCRADKRVLFLDIRTTSDKSNFDIVNAVRQSLQTRGIPFAQTRTELTIGGWLGEDWRIGRCRRWRIGETVADAAFKDVTFMVVTDIEIAEKARVRCHDPAKQVLKFNAPNLLSKA